MGVQGLGEGYIHGRGGQRQLSKSGDKTWINGSSAEQSELPGVRDIGHSVRKVDRHVPIDGIKDRF